MTPVLQYSKRILAYSNKSCSLFRFYGTKCSTEASQTLQSMIKAALDHKAQIIPVLDQWQQQGNQVKPSDIRCLIKKLCDSNQFSQALEASKWMGEEKVCNIVPKDYAARLLLTEKVLGLEEAEKFFKSIPTNMRDFTVYSMLLTSYTRSEETLDKSESTFKKMRELGFLLKPSPYNSMISLYSHLGKRDRVEKLLNEMEENNVKPDNVTVNNVLKFYANVSDVKAMEMFMKTWVNEKEEGIKLEQGTIVAMAKAYVRVGSERKAIEMYGDVAGSAREVHSVWKECKKTGKVNREGYRSVISALLKLNDVEGAEKIYGEWKEKEHEWDIIIEGLLVAQGKELKVIREQVNQLITKNPSTELVNLLIAQGNGLNENRELLAKRLTQLIELIPVLVPLGILYYFPLYLGVPLALFTLNVLILHFK